MFLKGGLFPGCDIKISFSTTSFKNSFVVTVLHDWWAKNKMTKEATVLKLTVA